MATATKRRRNAPSTVEAFKYKPLFPTLPLGMYDLDGKLEAIIQIEDPRNGYVRTMEQVETHLHADKVRRSECSLVLRLGIYFPADDDQEVEYVGPEFGTDYLDLIAMQAAIKNFDAGERNGFRLGIFVVEGGAN